MKVLTPKQVRAAIGADVPSHPVWEALYHLKVGGGIEVAFDEAEKPNSSLYAYGKKWGKKFSCRTTRDGWIISRIA